MLSCLENARSSNSAVSGHDYASNLALPNTSITFQKDVFGSLVVFEKAQHVTPLQSDDPKTASRQQQVCDSDQCFWSTTSRRFWTPRDNDSTFPRLAFLKIFFSPFESPFCRFHVDHYYESPKLPKTMAQNATSPQISSSPKLCQIYTDLTTLCRRHRRARRLHNYAVTKWFLHC